MYQKLTRLWGHLTRRRVLVYLVNSRGCTRLTNRVLVARANVHIDLGIVRNPALMGCRSIGSMHVPATFGQLLGIAQSLNISRAMRESWR